MILLGISFLIATAPVLLAIVLVPLQCGGYSNANEGNCGPAALPWLLFLSVPIGIITAIVGLITLITGLSKPPTAASTSAPPISKPSTEDQAPAE